MQGDHFPHVLIEHATFLKTQALKFTKNVQDADDLHQETLCKALEHFSKYRDDQNIQAWLYVIMRNIFINIYRRKKKFFLPMFAAIDDMPETSWPAKSCGIDLYYRDIVANIDKLPNKFKVPFILHREGYKYHEIAELVGDPIGTVKSNIFNARQMLKDIIPRNL